MKKNILFIADSSIRNPILQSQGFPFLYNLDSDEYRPFVFSFEESDVTKDENQELNEIIKKYENKITFLPVVINKSRIFPPRYYFLWNSIRSLLSIIKKNDIKLLHARSFNPAFLSIVIKIFFKPSIKVIYDNRGLYLDELIFRNVLAKGSLKERVLRISERIIIKKCDKMVVVSNAFNSYIVKRFSNSGNYITNKTTTIPNRTSIKFSEADIIFEQKKINNKTIGVYSGSSAAWQAIDELYILFLKMLRSIPEIYFKVLTYEPEYFINSLPQNAELTERMIVEKANSDEVKSNLLTATFGILLRKPHILNIVSAPIKFAEYLSAGLPVLAREGIGDTEQIIKKYNVGVILKGDDYKKAISELQELLNDNEVHNRCLTTANKEFNISTSFKQYQEIYDRLLSNY